MRRRASIPIALAGLAAILALGALGLLGQDGPDEGASPSGRREVLPPPATDGGMGLAAALSQRRSVRSFSGTPLTAAEIGQLLWAAQAVTDPAGHRTTPSAGATYPLEVDIVTFDGVARYQPAEHALIWRLAGELRPALREAALDQAAISDAPLVIVVSGVTVRTAGRYGDRAQRYVTLEAGHAAQNVLLQVTALGLGAVPIGSFDDEAVRRVLRLEADEAPLYLVPVGRQD